MFVYFAQVCVYTDGKSFLLIAIVQNGYNFDAMVINYTVLGKRAL